MDLTFSYKMLKLDFNPPPGLRQNPKRRFDLVIEQIVKRSG